MKSKETFLLSVIIPTYNRSRLLSYTLESVLLQTCPKNRFEVIISDDGSADDTKVVVEQYEAQLNIKYVCQEDLGYRVASARNLGIKVSSGDICLFIDSGVILDQNCLMEHINFHRNNGSDSAALGYVYGFEENSSLAEELVQIIDPKCPTETIKYLAGNQKYYDVREDHYRRYNDEIAHLPAPWIYFWTCHLSVLRRNLLYVNMFDESYDGKWGCEDNDLGFRLHKTGVKMSLLRDAKSVHYPHAKDKEKRHEEGFHNCVYFNNKFQTKETKIFLDNYRNQELVDVNLLSRCSNEGVEHSL